MTVDLDGVRHGEPGVLRTGDRALDEDQATLVVHADDFEVLLGALTVAHVAGHLLVLEHLARILTVTRRTVRTVRDRNTVGGAHTAEAPALHGALEALTLGVAAYVDQLAGHEVRGCDRGADFQKSVVGDAEFRDAHLQGNLSLGEMFALRLGNVLLLCFARTELNRDVAVTISSTNRNHLTVFKCQDSDGHMATVLLEQAGHPDFLGDHACTHDLSPYRGVRRTIPRTRVQPCYDTNPVRVRCSLQAHHGPRKRDGGRIPDTFPKEGSGGIPCVPEPFVRGAVSAGCGPQSRPWADKVIWIQGSEFHRSFKVRSKDCRGRRRQPRKPA